MVTNGRRETVQRTTGQVKQNHIKSKATVGGVLSIGVLRGGFGIARWWGEEGGRYRWNRARQRRTAAMTRPPLARSPASLPTPYLGPGPAELLEAYIRLATARGPLIHLHLRTLRCDAVRHATVNDNEGEAGPRRCQSEAMAAFS